VFAGAQHIQRALSEVVNIADSVQTFVENLPFLPPPPSGGGGPIIRPGSKRKEKQKLELVPPKPEPKAEKKHLYEVVLVSDAVSIKVGKTWRNVADFFTIRLEQAQEASEASVKLEEVKTKTDQPKKSPLEMIREAEREVKRIKRGEVEIIAERGGVDKTPSPIQHANMVSKKALPPLPVMNTDEISRKLKRIGKLIKLSKLALVLKLSELVDSLR
jgi:hypothetical protein